MKKETPLCQSLPGYRFGEEGSARDLKIWKLKVIATTVIGIAILAVLSYIAVFY